MAETKKNEFKRHFPRLEQCVCCCCCTPETSVKIATAVLLICHAFVLLISIRNYPIIDQLSFDFTSKIFNYAAIVVNIIVCLSFIFLLIGISRINFLFLNQFKFIYFFYLIFTLISSIYSYTLIYNDDYRKQQIEIIKEEYSKSDLFKNHEFSTDELNETIKRSAASTLCGYVVGFIILFYYYITTCSYIENLEENAEEERKARNIENNQN